MSEDDWSRGLLGWLSPRKSYLSAAGRLIADLEAAERAVVGEEHITDELRAAMRRADIKAMRA